MISKLKIFITGGRDGKSLILLKKCPQILELLSTVEMN